MKVRKTFQDKKGTDCASLEFIKDWRRWLLHKTPDGLRRIEKITNATVSVHSNDSVTVRMYFGDDFSASIDYKSLGVFIDKFLNWYAKNNGKLIRFITMLSNPEIYEKSRSLAISYGIFVKKYGGNPNDIFVNDTPLAWKD